MSQMYIIYVKDSIIRIEEAAQTGSETLTNAENKDFTAELVNRIRELMASSASTNFTITAADPKKLLKALKHELAYIKAAGGLIRNDAGEYLFIHRRGKWDLPKGKIEPEEKAEQAAIREVEEECGLKISLLKKELPSTYHVYFQDDVLMLKRTCWYLMKCRGDQVLVPQAEEDITDARWFKTEALGPVRENTYNSVLQVMENIPEPQLKEEKGN